MLPIIALILLPFIVYTNNIHTSHLYSFMSFGLGFLWWNYRGNKIIRIFMLYVTVHIIVAPMVQHEFLNAYIDLLFILSGSAMFICVTSSKIKDKTWTNLLAVLCALHSVIAILQWLDMNPILWIYPGANLGINPISSFYGNSEYMTHNLAVMSPFIFGLRKKLWFLILLPVSVILFSKCLGAAVAFLAALVCYFLIKNHHRLTRITIGFAIAAAFLSAGLFNQFLNDYPDLRKNTRVEAWSKTAVHIVSGGPVKLIAGNGIGQNFTDHIEHNIHNGFLLVGVKYGVIGVGLILAYLVSIWKHRDRYSPFIIPSLVACLVAIFLNNFLQLVPSMMLLIIILGLAERSRFGGRIYAGSL